MLYAIRPYAVSDETAMTINVQEFECVKGSGSPPAQACIIVEAEESTSRQKECDKTLRQNVEAIE